MTFSQPSPLVLKHLPHRPPLLLIDNVTTWDVEQKLVATRTFAVDEPIFVGHFPGYPILPGMLTVEAMAQAAGLLINLSRDLTAEETTFLFMGAELVKFRQPICPPCTVEFRVTQNQNRGDVYKYSGEAWLNGKLAASANFTAKVEIK